MAMQSGASIMSSTPLLAGTKKEKNQIKKTLNGGLNTGQNLPL